MFSPHRVAITANRLLLPEDHGVIFTAMTKLLTDPAVEAIYFGGAIGGDTIALQACLDVVMMDRPRLIVVVPNMLKNQPSSTHTASKSADELIELGRPITNADGWRAFHARNEYMVDHAQTVVAFWNKVPKGGTYACMSYARKQGKPVEIVEIKGEDK